MTLATTALLLLVQSLPPGFGACQATPVVRGWAYDCPGTRLSIEDHDGTVSPAYLDGVEASAVALVGEGATTTRSRRKMAGLDAEVREFANPSAERFAAFVVVAHPSGTRLLRCHMEPLNRCLAILESLARLSEWRGGPVSGAVRGATPKLAIAGHEVAAPEGCEVDVLPRGGRIVCRRGGVAFWASTDRPEVAVQMKQKLDRDLPALAPSERVTRDELQCHLGGVATTCTRLTVEKKNDRAVYLWATADVRGDTLVAFCSESTVDAIAGPCSLLFQVP